MQRTDGWSLDAANGPLELGALQRTDGWSLDAANGRLELGCSERTAGAWMQPRPRVLKEESKYRGVTWKKKSSQCVAKIHFPGKTEHLGYFDDEAEAGVRQARAAARPAADLSGVEIDYSDLLTVGLAPATTNPTKVANACVLRAAVNTTLLPWRRRRLLCTLQRRQPGPRN